MELVSLGGRCPASDSQVMTLLDLTIGIASQSTFGHPAVLTPFRVTSFCVSTTRTLNRGLALDNQISMAAVAAVGRSADWPELS